MLLIKPELRHKVLKHVFLWRDQILKAVGARSGRSAGSIWNRLSRKNRKRPLGEKDFRETLADLDARPAHAAVTAFWIEAMAELDRIDDGLTPEERDEREMRVLQVARVYREHHTKLGHLSRDMPPLDRYPEPGDLAPIRWLAREQLALLKEHKDPGERLAIVRHVPEYQHWGLAEAGAEESAEATSRSVEEAADWARLAAEAAERMKGPDWWQSRVRGYAGGFGPNALRVAGELEAASATLEEPKRLWRAGADPIQVLDPGRLLDLEGSLRRAQRRFPEALARLAEALAVTHHRVRVLLKKAFTQEVMGEYESAVQTLREAEPLIDRHRDPRHFYMLRYNLGVLYTHLSRYPEADALVQEVRDLITARGDENELARVTWLEGRIALGLGRARKARELLEDAIGALTLRSLWYDVALAVLELCVLLLGEGRTAEVRALTPRLNEVFASQKVHREALAALQLFQEAAEKEEADEDLARRVLDFLFRARHDQGLQFES
jgi:tetratricopeptide (TPR) repeat protein